MKKIKLSINKIIIENQTPDPNLIQNQSKSAKLKLKKNKKLQKTI